METIRNIKNLKLPLFLLGKLGNDIRNELAFELGADELFDYPLNEDLFKRKIYRYMKKSTDQTMTELPEVDQDCQIQVHAWISEINENEIIIESPHYFAHSEDYVISGNLVRMLYEQEEDVTIPITKSWYDTEEDIYKASLAIDLTNEKLVENMREWLIDKQYKKPNAGVDGET
jgi:hypothetical protein